ncbi:cilia- and flagella-associated protein 418 isoform X2 [Hyla sarda]|uniref:cilia- and flagella-associated protein 418 isoform X2 n=1 Tax=Hyla sarda TaxID=327740 RepID=UPI0024C2C94C|nr:cilia- and flagella-associated protein 418 isoform X2 [Hyla sarda]
MTKASKAIVTVDDEDVDDLIEDILDVRFYEENKHKAKSTEHQSCKSSTQHPSKKCCPVYLGGSGIPFGIGTSISERACDQLRCTTCDFNIVMFDDYKWEASCDYLFFRNSMPEHSKLQTKMVRKKGARAYACQCSWRSIQQITDLSSEPQLRFTKRKWWSAHSGRPTMTRTGADLAEDKIEEKKWKSSRSKQIIRFIVSKHAEQQ